MEKETYRVTGPYQVAGTDPGGTVELDPETVNVSALLESGHVEPVKKRSATPARETPAGSDVT